MVREILKGRVTKGADRGKDLGFPTANLDIPSRALPRSGVYAVWVRIEGERLWRTGAANVGFNPTFDEKTRKLEVHLLDFAGDLYGKTLEIALAHYLRPEKRYRTVAGLIRQMRRDCRRAAKLLARSARSSPPGSLPPGSLPPGNVPPGSVPA
jgi:riboflavin kinase/FMN adenylyltransferase